MTIRLFILAALVAFTLPGINLIKDLNTIKKISSSVDVPHDIDSYEIGSKFYAVASPQSELPLALSIISFNHKQGNKGIFDLTLSPFTVDFPSKKNVTLLLEKMTPNHHTLSQLKFTQQTDFSNYFRKPLSDNIKSNNSIFMQEQFRFEQIIIKKNENTENQLVVLGYKNADTLALKDTITMHLALSNYDSIIFNSDSIRSAYRSSCSFTCLDKNNPFLAEFTVVGQNPLVLSAESPITYQPKVMFDQYWDDNFSMLCIRGLLLIFGLIILIFSVVNIFRKNVKIQN